MHNTVLTSKAFFYNFLGQLFIQAIKLVPTRSNVWSTVEKQMKPVCGGPCGIEGSPARCAASEVT